MTEPMALPDSGLIEDLPSRVVLRGLFHLLFGREPDLSDDGAYVLELETGTLSPRQLVEWLVESAEWSHVAPMTELIPALHYGRGVFIRSLPRARRILDLGGTAIGDARGALVHMGYPYDFDEIVIVDLPVEDRHALYRDEARPATVRIDQGLITYRYHSMTELGGLPSASFDMVYSGQSIEHVTRRDASKVLAQVRRVLKPGGVLAIDTPNGRVTRVQQVEFIDPDHKYEYTHREMVALLEGSGLHIERAHGISYGGRSTESGAFDESEIATRRGLYDDIECCYLLAYVCRRPRRTGPVTQWKRAAWTVRSTTAAAGRAAGRAARQARERASGGAVVPETRQADPADNG
jgi:SAM-dependent methyltransferase